MRSKDDRTCSYPRCSRPSTVRYAYKGSGYKPLCDKHWELVSSEDDKIANKAKEKIGIRED